MKDLQNIVTSFNYHPHHKTPNYASKMIVPILRRQEKIPLNGCQVNSIQA